MYTETILSGSGSIAVPFQMQGPSADNPILCAQFLRGYTDLEILKNIRPEDIEDISERFSGGVHRPDRTEEFYSVV